MVASLSRTVARRYLLSYHYLTTPRTLSGVEGVRAVMDRLRCIQVDPLDVVGRNVHLVMQSRIRDFAPHQLDSLVYEHRYLVEAWDKVRSIVVAENWPRLWLFRERVLEHHLKSGNPPVEILDYVRSQLSAKGPISSLELEDKGTADWHWGPARAVRAALEVMFDWGEIGIAGRTAGRKIYAPIAEVLPATIAASRPVGEDSDGYLRWHVEQRIRSTGLIADRSGQAWIGIEGATAPRRRRALEALEACGSVRRVAVEGVSAPCFVPAREPGLPERGRESGAFADDEAAFIAPLDNVLWDRRLIEELFDFDYTWEVYKPASTREYGYYVLPVLLGDRFIARWEPRRSDGALLVRGWWWERTARASRDDPAAVVAVGRAIVGFMRFLGVGELGFEAGVSARDRTFLRRALASGRKAGETAVDER